MITSETNPGTTEFWHQQPKTFLVGIQAVFYISLEFLMDTYVELFSDLQF